MRKSNSKRILFVDFPQLINRKVRYDLKELFSNLWVEFDEIWTFAKIPREPKDEKDVWSIIRVATLAGALPMLYPSDVDGIINAILHKFLSRRDVKEIALLSGDNGFFLSLQTAKKTGKRIKVILPPNNNSYLLKSVADDIAMINDYTKVFNSNKSLKTNVVTANPVKQVCT